MIVFTMFAHQVYTNNAMSEKATHNRDCQVHTDEAAQSVKTSGRLVSWHSQG